MEAKFRGKNYREMVGATRWETFLGVGGAENGGVLTIKLLCIKFLETSVRARKKQQGLI